jgi:hypothetical protein
MILPSAFAKMLDEFMDASGLNGNALAEAIGVKPTSISGWRHGRDFPDGDSMRRIIETLRGRISDDDARILLRAWMELRLGDVAKLSWEDGQPSKGKGTDGRAALDQMLWRWTHAEREDIHRLLQQAELKGVVREALVALARCI